MLAGAPVSGRTLNLAFHGAVDGISGSGDGRGPDLWVPGGNCSPEVVERPALLGEVGQEGEREAQCQMALDRDFRYDPPTDTYRCPVGEMLIRRFASIENGLTVHTYWSDGCATCTLKAKCTTGKERRIKRWEHEHVVEAMQNRLERMPNAMRLRRSTVEHVFGTWKDWMGRSHFKTRTIKRVKTEMSLHVLAYNMKRAITVLGTEQLIAAMQR
jgi:Transposase DDE domain